MMQKRPALSNYQFCDIFESPNYVRNEPIFHKSIESPEVKEKFELPQRPRSFRGKITNEFAMLREKFIPIDIFKLKDDEDNSLICEEFYYKNFDDITKLHKVLKTMDRHENLLSFTEIHIFEKESKFWLLSTDNDLQFLKKRLNREVRSPFSIQTIIKFYHDIEAAIRHLSQVEDRYLSMSIFNDVIIPMISTTGILYNADDDVFKIGLSFAFAIYWDVEKRYAHQGFLNCLKQGHDMDNIRPLKKEFLCYSLGVIFLEMAIGYFFTLNGGCINISDGPYKKDSFEFKKIKEILQDIRKEQMFPVTQDQLKFLDDNHLQKVAKMILEPSEKLWNSIFEDAYFEKRVWSYRINANYLNATDFVLDWPHKFFDYDRVYGLKNLRVADGISPTIFLHFYEKTKRVLTGDLYKDHTSDEDKVKHFFKDMAQIDINKTVNYLPDLVSYTINKSLEMHSEDDGKANDNKKSTIHFEISAIFKKNCIVHKCWLDILTLSVEFGDDLNHLSSIIATTFPFMSTEIDEQRRVVFRIANTMSPGDRVVDIMLDTLDLMIITVNSIRYKFDECIKGERFGRLSKSSIFVAEEILEKIREYKDVKQYLIRKSNEVKRTNIFS